MFKELYDHVIDHAVKPKFHQLMHVPEDARDLWAFLSWWVLERKHREVKSIAKFLFRHIEHTTTVDLVNRQTERFIEAENLFSPQYLVSPQPAIPPLMGMLFLLLPPAASSIWLYSNS